jgi:hypothetical protein
MLAVQDEPMMVRTLALVIVRQVLGLVGCGPSPDAKDVEIAVLHRTPPWAIASRRRTPNSRGCTFHHPLTAEPRERYEQLRRRNRPAAWT